MSVLEEIWDGTKEFGIVKSKYVFGTVDIQLLFDSACSFLIMGYLESA